MSSSYDFDDHDRSTPLSHLSQYIPETWTFSSSSLGALLLGAYVLFKSLELAGYPVYLWLHQLLQMASDYDYSPLLSWSRSSSPDLPDADASDNSPASSMQSRAGSIFGNLWGTGSGVLGKGVRGLTGALSMSPKNVPAGLGNWDNSCYQNSVIQGLASLPSLRDYLNDTTTEHKSLDAESTNGALSDMIKKLNDPDNHGQHFWIRGKLKTMSTFQQQDAQEYYSKILDELDKEVKQASNSKRRRTASFLEAAMELSEKPEQGEDGEGPETAIQESDKPVEPEQPHVVPNPLDGLQAQRVGCTNCGYTEGLSLIPFNCITVPLGKNWEYDVRECLDEFTQLEYIEGVECAKCTMLKMEQTLSKLPMAKVPGNPMYDRLKNVQEVLEDEDFEDKTLFKKCGLSKKVWVKSTKSRQAVIARAPKALVLHVNRSIFDEMTGAQYKNNAAVRYPGILDLGNWCLGTRPSESQKPDESIEEAWPRDPKQSMLANANAEPTTDSPFQYRLRAAITHFGNHGNGHYICYRQHPFKVKPTEPEEGDAEAADEPDNRTETNEQWWHLSDDHVYEVSEKDALDQGRVFMLFYERFDPNAVPHRPADEDAIGATAAELLEHNAPLPPADWETIKAEILDLAQSATAVPLPGDDFDDLPLSPPESPRISHIESIPIPPTEKNAPEEASELSAYPTPPPETPQSASEVDSASSEAEATINDSEDGASSAKAPSDDGEKLEAQDFSGPVPQHRQSPSPGPHRMRTAGNISKRKGSTAQSLPMVPAL